MPKATGLTRSIVAAPATAESPNCAIQRVTKAAATGVARLVRIAGAATAISVLASAASRLTSSRSSMRWCTSTPYRPTDAITARDTTEAMAAPSSPSLKPKIKIGSSTAVTPAAASATTMARRASPTARSSAAHAMPMASSGSECTLTAR